MVRAARRETHAVFFVVGLPEGLCWKRVGNGHVAPSLTATIPPFDLTKPLDQNICSELKDSYGESSGRFTRAFAWDEGGAAGSVRSREASTTSCKTVQENLTVTAHPILFSKFYHRQRCASYNVRLRCAIPHKVYTRVYIDDGETGSKFGDFWQTCAKGEAFPKGPTKCTSVHSV
jgi:hypothetical protein